LTSNWIFDARVPPLMVSIEITTNNGTIRDIDSLQTPFNGRVINYIRISSFPSFVVDIENPEFFNVWA
jgi:hypothetical protein